MNARMGRNARHLACRGLTLVETMASIVVVSVMAAVCMPMIDGATEAYVQSSSLRRSTESVSFALDRSVRLIRAIPLGSDNTSVAISTMTANSIRFVDGRGLEMSGTSLLLRDATGATGVLCEGVQTFTLAPLASDGVTSSLSTPGETRRVNITIKAASVEMRGTAFIRVGALGI